MHSLKSPISTYPYTPSNPQSPHLHKLPSNPHYHSSFAKYSHDHSICPPYTLAIWCPPFTVSDLSDSPANSTASTIATDISHIQICLKLSGYISWRFFLQQITDPLNKQKSFWRYSLNKRKSVILAIPFLSGISSVWKTLTVIIFTWNK